MIETAPDTAPEPFVLPPGELDLALSGSMLEPRYQPIVRIADHQPVALEVLARLNHPRHGMLAPLSFVPQIEAAGLAARLTETMTGRAFADMAGPELAPHRLDFAVNFPLNVLLVPQAATLLDAQCDHTGIEPSRVIIELTESQPVTDPAALRRALTDLRRRGYQIVIDDTDPAMPWIQSLLDLPFTGCKLDKDVVQALGRDAGADAFVARMMALAERQGMTVTAEGVEDTATWERLAQHGVHQAQGFLVAQPLIAASIPDWLSLWCKQPRLV